MRTETVEPILLSENPHCELCDRSFLKAYADEIFYKLTLENGLTVCSACLFSTVLQQSEGKNGSKALQVKRSDLDRNLQNLLQASNR